MDREDWKQTATLDIILNSLTYNYATSCIYMGMDYKKKYLISGTYTTQTSALSNYTNGSFELNLWLNLSK